MYILHGNLFFGLSNQDSSRVMASHFSIISREDEHVRLNMGFFLSSYCLTRVSTLQAYCVRFSLSLSLLHAILHMSLYFPLSLLPLSLSFPPSPTFSSTYTNTRLGNLQLLSDPCFCFSPHPTLAPQQYTTTSATITITTISDNNIGKLGASANVICPRRRRRIRKMQKNATRRA